MSTQPQRPLDHVGKYLLNWTVIIIHSRLNCPEIFLFFSPFQMTKIQGRQACPELVEGEEEAQRRYEPITKPPWFRDRRNAILEPRMVKNS
jgi:hypothetical protein